MQTRCAPHWRGCATTSSVSRSARTPARRSRRTRRTHGPTRWFVQSMPRRAASVNLPMRRTILMAVLAALLVVPTAAHADGTRTKILRDCQDDGILQGDYSAAQMRDARDNQPAELLEYSDCGDVLTRAISNKTAPKDNGTNGGSTGGTGGTGGGTGSGSGGSSSGGTAGGGSSDPAATSTPDSAGPPDTGRALPQTPQEWQAINEAQKQGPAMTKDLKQISPGAQLTAEVGRNGLPAL